MTLRRRIRLRKWGTVVTLAATLQGGGGDPVTQALEYHSNMTSVAERAADAVSISRHSDRSERSATPALLELIKQHESNGNYRAVNPTGCEGQPCGGAYQLHSQYASSWAAQAGYPGLSPRAETWPASTQDAVALHLFLSTDPHGAHWCNWTDYC